MNFPKTRCGLWTIVRCIIEPKIICQLVRLILREGGQDDKACGLPRSPQNFGRPLLHYWAGKETAMWKAVVVVVCLGLGTWADTPKLSEVSAKALQFFARIEDANFDVYLKRVRLPQVTATFKAQVLAQLAKEKGVKVSEKMRAKLDALMPLLQYHERDAVLEIKVIEAPQAIVRTQGRAVLLLSETTLRLLSTEELQAIMAHELGHEYFWGDLMQAREQKNYALLREIELRCDGIAVIALHRLGIDAQKLLGAITKLTTFNARIMITDPLYHPLLSDRMDFIQAMRELVQAKAMAKSSYLNRSSFSDRTIARFSSNGSNTPCSL